MSSALDCISIVKTVFPRLGINKVREISRLVYEISKRDSKTPAEIISGLEKAGFEKLKKKLLSVRYPLTFAKNPPDAYYLPELSSNKIKPAKAEKFNPELICFEASCEKSPVLRRLAELFPSSRVEKIAGLRDFVSKVKSGPADYSLRKNALILACEQHDFFKACPCTKNVLCCGYSVLNTAFGCMYDCSYCFLQQYQNAPGIILNDNISDFLDKALEAKLPKGIFPAARLGSGEFSDSLVFDHITEHSRDIINHMRSRPDIVFEFKTKSVNVGNILKTPPAENIVVSWSLNSREMIAGNELNATSLDERFAAARECVRAGYRVGFHFDPVIIYKGWEGAYSEVCEELAASFPEDKVAWISVGTLRFNPGIKKNIEARFPDNPILDGELTLGFDGKMRYHRNERVRVYKNMFGFIRKNWKDVFVYLCMEPADVWKDAGLRL